MKDYLMSLLSRKPRNAFKFDSKVSGFDRGVWTNTPLSSLQPTHLMTIGDNNGMYGYANKDAGGPLGSIEKMKVTLK